MNVLPTDAAARNAMPMADGLLFYFPNALAAVSALSLVANAQHNPGEPMHWARNKSTDHANKIIKHLVDAGGIDADLQRHSTKVAWRALALLEDELIAEGATPGRNAKGSPVSAARELYDATTAIHAAQDANTLPLTRGSDGRVGFRITAPADSSYLASFRANGSRIATAAEITELREHLTVEQLREYGIGDVPPRLNARSAHPMAAEALRQHDERLNGPEDSL